MWSHNYSGSKGAPARIAFVNGTPVSYLARQARMHPGRLAEAGRRRLRVLTRLEKSLGEEGCLLQRLLQQRLLFPTTSDCLGSTSYLEDSTDDAAKQDCREDAGSIGYVCLR